MDRREFLKKSMAGTAVMTAPGLLLPACGRNLRRELMVNRPVVSGNETGGLDPDGYQILYYASLAPSGHNSQPWVVKIKTAREWIVGSDKNRWLPAVDGDNREALLSIGAFVENLVQAAHAFGYEAQTRVVAAGRFDEEVIKIRLKKANFKADTLKRIISRRTVKSNLLNTELSEKDVKDFSILTDDQLYYFPRSSEHCDLMANEAVENFILQFNNESAVKEMAIWSRFKDADQKKFRDGLTPDGMEITGIAGFYVRHFMDHTDVLSLTWKEKGIEKIRQQASQGGGWLVITSDGNSVVDLIQSGRRFQRMALAARQKNIALHPMTQALEEKQGQKNIKENHHPSVIPQFMLRVGYVDRYPDPVSLRRPVEWFVKPG